MCYSSPNALVLPCKRRATHVCGDGQDGDPLQDGLPGPDVLGLLWQDAPKLSDDFPSINPDLKQVVGKSEDWGQREGGHEQSHEAELDHCGRKYVYEETSQDSAETGLKVGAILPTVPFFLASFC